MDEEDIAVGGVNRTHFVPIRMVVRIMVMVPLYAISSLISLFSLEAAFVIDAFRDIYEVCRVSYNCSLDYDFFSRLL